MEANITSGLSPSPEDPCYLLELPGELRNEIFNLALYSPDGFKIDCVSQKSIAQSPLALTQTCKQIRKECGDVFFRQNAVTFMAPLQRFSRAERRTVENFIQGVIHESGRTFRSIHLSVGVVWCYEEFRVDEWIRAWETIFRVATAAQVHNLPTRLSLVVSHEDSELAYDLPIIDGEHIRAQFYKHCPNLQGSCTQLFVFVIGSSIGLASSLIDESQVVTT